MVFENASSGGAQIVNINHDFNYHAECKAKIIPLFLITVRMVSGASACQLFNAFLLGTEKTPKNQEKYKAKNDKKQFFY